MITLFVLLILSLAGYALRSLGIINEPIRKILYKYVFYIAVPVAVVDAIVTGLQVDVLLYARFLAVNLFAYLVVFWLASWWALKRGYNHKRAGVLRFASNTPNSIFIGFPVILALFDQQFFIYAVLLGTLGDAILNAIRITVLQKKQKGKHGKHSLHVKNFVNPISLSLLASFILVAFQVQLPNVLAEPMHIIGKSASYVALLVMGASLYGMAFRKRDRSIMREIVAFKLFLMPAIVMFLVWLFGVEAEPAKLSVIISALPAAIFTLIISENLKFDSHLAADSIFMTTLLSPLTVAVWWWLAGIVL